MSCALKAGLGTRVLKILRAEWQRQARIYRSLLWTVLQDPNKPRSDNRRLREFFIIVDRTTEFLWLLSLQRLRSTVPKKRPVATGDVKTCYVVGDSNQVACQDWSQSIFCRRSLAVLDRVSPIPKTSEMASVLLANIPFAFGD
ncbi:hypothetical protein HPB47_023672 [Ixodes persulcatus]|uniref:Uncharacterized protein n=1 Tax=Ixodes persulcatus TaxID=34615 RepID=A0AC60Q6M9_IXOPE|nr:hypothetical protein HPB47_023672 [Ixodes persulcatus]